MPVPNLQGLGHEVGRLFLRPAKSVAKFGVIQHQDKLLSRLIDLTASVWNASKHSRFTYTKAQNGHAMARVELDCGRDGKSGRHFAEHYN